MALIYNATFDKNTRKLSFEDKAGNEIYSFTVPERAPAVDDLTKPLTFKATQDGSTVALGRYGYPSGTFQTSRDGGNTWEDYTINTAITLNNGDEVSFRTSADRTSAQTDKVYFYFAMKGKIEAWHNVMSLYRTNDFSTFKNVVGYAFYRMFDRCTSLTKAPSLPATALDKNCYRSMFDGCTSLTKAPALPATTLDNSCYSNMFKGCTSLSEAPALPATTLAQYCYSNMFYGCRSLTKAPELPATTLADNCYYIMLEGCSSLNEVRCNIPSSYSSSTISSYASNWLLNVSSTGTFYTNADANWSSGASGIPTGWTRVNEGGPAVDDITKPLTFKATQDGSTVKLSKNGAPDGAFQTSTDGGNTWSDYTIDTVITLNTGEEVSFRAKSDREFEQSDSKYFQFNMTGKIEAWHNVMSLYRTNDFATYESVMKFAFYRLFKDCTSLTKAPVLPATTLAQSCYSNMFKGCTSLTKAPALPATDFINLDASIDASNCYESMFWGCTSLTEAPELPATKLNIRCYDNMFYDCTSLTKAPELPATILEESCYESMFSGCASLTKAPDLPSTSLAFHCYSGMFNYCTSLVNAPALPATTLKQRCYNWMFARCISLTKAPELTATKLASECYTGMFLGCDMLNEVHCYMPSTISAGDVSKYTGSVSDAWLYGVSSTGTFYTNADANWPSGSTSGIPAGWTRTNT